MAPLPLTATLSTLTAAPGRRCSRGASSTTALRRAGGAEGSITAQICRESGRVALGCSSKGAARSVVSVRPRDNAARCSGPNCNGSGARQAHFNHLKDDEDVKARLRHDPACTIAPHRLDGSLSIVFATSEVSPWSKTGGLGDVCGALPIALAARGHRVMVVSPLYSSHNHVDDITSTGITVNIEGENVHFFHSFRNGVDWVFACHAKSFQRDSGGLYGDESGAYKDNLSRFRLLSLAALEAPLKLPLGGALYGEDITLVANDWPTALAPLYLAAKYRPSGVYIQARTSLIVHNLRHQGVFHPSEFPLLGLSHHWYSVLEYLYKDSAGLNVLKAGILTADKIITVSENYANEIQTPSGGWGLESLLALRGKGGGLAGVVNGIDTVEWNPATDPHLPFNYGLSNFSQGKAWCKASLQEELGLRKCPFPPLIAFIGRLDEQKGIDLLLRVAPELIAQGCQCVFLGTGDPKLEEGLRRLTESHPGEAAGMVGFSVPLSHRITAAADLLVMPSRFEPCGLNQQYAMRYATPVVAHATGGLTDTVIHYDPWKDEGTGWTFSPCEEQPLKDALSTALYTLREHPDAFWGMKYRMIRKDFSWLRAAAKYEQIFLQAVSQPPQAMDMHYSLLLHGC